VTVKLHGIPAMISSAVCAFPSLEAACNTAMTVVAGGQTGDDIAVLALRRSPPV